MRPGIAAGLGWLLGLGLAFAQPELAIEMPLYAPIAAALLGAAIAAQHLGGRVTFLRRVAIGAMTGLVTQAVVRSLPLPWMSLLEFSGGAGPAGTLTMVTLPTAGLAFGYVFARDRRVTDHAPNSDAAAGTAPSQRG